jgi:hypothetical protein
MKRHLRSIADHDEQRSIGTGLRRKQWEAFHRRFPNIENMRFDLGCSVKQSEISFVRPISVVVLNLQPESSDIIWTRALQKAASAPSALAMHGFSSRDTIATHATHCRPMGWCREQTTR